jgi:uncharacterized protein involved in type VI secretion and phage assembly
VVAIVSEWDTRATIPIRVGGGLNRREHWRVRARRVRAERDAVRLALGAWLRPVPAEELLEVHLVSVAPRVMDDDNLAGALKAVRDEVAALLGRGDDPRAGIRWTYGQERGAPREYAVRVELAEVPRW